MSYGVTSKNHGRFGSVGRKRTTGAAVYTNQPAIPELVVGVVVSAAVGATAVGATAFPLLPLLLLLLPRAHNQQVV